MKYIDYLDKQILIFFHQNRWNEPQWMWHFFSQKYIWFLLAVFVLWKLRQSSKKQILLIFLIFGLCILLTDRISSGFFKPFFQRLRPCHQQELKTYLVLFNNHCGGKFGFVSSHAANIWGWTILYFQLFQLQFSEKLFWFFIAFMITLSRFMLGVHFLTDLLVGSILGICIAFCISLIYKKKKFPISK